MSVLTRREASIFAGLADAVAMPTPPMAPASRARTPSPASTAGWPARRA